MKKYLCIAAALLIALSLYACGKETKQEQKTTEAEKTNFSPSETVSTSTTTFYIEENKKEIIKSKFIVKEVNSTLLTLAKYDNNAGELKEGLYRGDYGKLENAENFNIKVGDILAVYYESNVAETYPYQINITDIVFAGL